MQNTIGCYDVVRSMGFLSSNSYLGLCREANPHKTSCLQAASVIDFEAPIYSSDYSALCSSANEHTAGCIYFVFNSGLGENDTGVYNRLCEAPQENTVNCYRSVYNTDPARPRTYEESCL